MGGCDQPGRAVALPGDSAAVVGTGFGSFPKLALTLGLAGLFGVALWARVSSIETAPLPDGDEAWYGVQVEHLLQGKPFAVRTGNGNPLNPFHAGLQIPLLWAFPPAFWMLRVPSMLAGILAVVLMYGLMARVLDRTTALIAAGLLAAMPVAVFFSRMGCDVSQTPLFNVLAFYYAFKGHRAGVLLSFLCCWLAHPTNLFLLPMLAPIFLVRTLRRHPDDPARGWRSGSPRCGGMRPSLRRGPPPVAGSSSSSTSRNCTCAWATSRAPFRRWTFRPKSSGESCWWPSSWARSG